MINLISLTISAIFYKAVLNIIGTRLIMALYNAKKNVVSGLNWKLGFSQMHGPIKLINHLYTSKTVPQSDFSGPFLIFVKRIIGVLARIIGGLHKNFWYLPENYGIAF